MNGYISTSVIGSLNHTYYRVVADLHTFQSTAAHTLGFSVSTIRLLAMDLDKETSTSNHYEVFFPFLVQSPWNLGTQLETLLDPSQAPSPHSLISFWHGPHRKHVSRVTLRIHWSVTSAGRGADDIESTASSIVA
jgi:hypothetical protein